MAYKPINPLNDEQRSEFDGYIKKWQERLGLQDWRIERSKKRTKFANMAEMEIDHVARLASYRTGDWKSAAITPQSLEATALHELLHVVLCELKNQTDYGIEGEALDSAEHRVIHVLEKLLVP